jgi:hypothetical protein
MDEGYQVFSPVGNQRKTPVPPRYQFYLIGTTTVYKSDTTII